MLSAMTLDQLSTKMRCENRRLKLVQPKLGQLRSQGSPLQRGLKRPQENATDDAVLWGVSGHIVPHLPAHGSCPESLPVGFCGVSYGRLGFAERWVPSFLISPDATRPPGWKPRRPVIVATRCCGAAHGGPSLALTGLPALPGLTTCARPLLCRTTIQPDGRKLARSIMLIKTALLSKLSIAIRAVAVPVPY
jgi:hypothetical protein